MSLQKSSAPWAPSENDAERLTAQLRASRLTVLCGDARVPMTDLLTAGVLPRLQRRSEDRAAAIGMLKRKVLRTPERRQRAAGADAEVVVFFDQWQGPAREALMAGMHAALKPRKASKQKGPLPQRVGDRLKLLSDRCGVRFLMVFDRFEQCLLASPDNHDLRALREEIYSAINHGEMAVQFLLTVQEQDEPLLDRLRGRVRGFDAARLLVPIEGAEDGGTLTLSTVPLPQAASALTRTAQTGAVYASIEAMLEQMTRRNPAPEDGMPPEWAGVPELPVEPVEAARPDIAEPLAPVPEAEVIATPPLAPSHPAEESTPAAVAELLESDSAVAPALEAEAAAEPIAPVAAAPARDPEAEARAQATLEMVIAMAEEAIAAAVAQQQRGGADSPAEAPGASAQIDAETGPEAASATAGAADMADADPTVPEPAGRSDTALATLFTEASLSSFMSELDGVIEQASQPSQRAAGLAGVAAPDMQRWADEVSGYADGANAAVDAAGAEEPVGAPPAMPAVPATPELATAADDALPEEPPPPEAAAEAPAAVTASPSSMLVVRGARAPVAARGARVRGTRAPRLPRTARMLRTLVPLATLGLLVVAGFWGLRGPDGALPWAGESEPPLAALPIEPTAAGGVAVAGVPPIELVAPGPIATRLADELAQGFHPGSGQAMVVRGTQGWAEDLRALRGAQRLAIARHDALQAARGDPAIGPLQIVMPLYAEELVFVVRDDSPLRYIHQIEGQRIGTGDPGSARALTVRTAYERLFASKLPEAKTDPADEPAALKALLDRSTDVVALVGSVPGHWLDPQSLQGAGALRLLTLDRNHPASRRALRALLPARLAVGVDGRPAAQPTPTLAMMSFLVAAGGSWGGAPRARPAAQDADEAAAIGAVTRSLCERLPVLQRDGHPKWAEVRPAIPINAGWPYSPEARRVLRDCTARASGGAQQGTATDVGQGAIDAMKLAGFEDRRR